MSVAAAATTTVPRQEHVETASQADRHRVRTAFAFLAPSLLGLILFLVIPIIFVIGLSLVQWNMLSPMTKMIGITRNRITPSRLGARKANAVRTRCRLAFEAVSTCSCLGIVVVAAAATLIMPPEDGTVGTGRSGPVSLMEGSTTG